MRTLKTLKPGQNGTKELLARYGTSLLCVRYRYDEVTDQHLKTVELIVQRRSRPLTRTIAEKDPPPGRGSGLARPPAKCPPRPRRSASRTVALRIHWREAELRRRVKSAGAWWSPERRVWLLRRDQAERLNLLHRVVGG